MRADDTAGTSEGSRVIDTSAPTPGMMARERFEFCVERHVSARNEYEELGKLRSHYLLLARRYLGQARRLIQEIIKEEGPAAAVKAKSEFRRAFDTHYRKDT